MEDFKIKFLDSVIASFCELFHLKDLINKRVIVL